MNAYARTSSRTGALPRPVIACFFALAFSLLLARSGTLAVRAAPMVPPAVELFLPFVGTEPPVPEEYRTLYGDLDAALSGFQATLYEQWDGTRGDTIFSAELTPASGNVGERLLRTYYMDYVLDYLNGLEAAGARGIVLQISYPLLLPDFPRADEFLAFYQEVAAEVQGRGLKLLVESSPVFAGTQFSGVPVDYSDLTPETYFAGRRDMLVTIAEQIGPDYLSLVDEPDTDIALTDLDLTVEGFVSFIDDVVTTIGPESDVLLGAGNGSWEGLSYIEAFATETDIDFLNVHVYPVISPGLDPLAALIDIANLAQAEGKRILIGESWPYKVTTQELVWGGLASFFDRDVFGFWEPIDVQFIDALATLAYTYDLDFVSFFWSRYLFAYLNYDDYPADTWGYTLLHDAESASYDALLAGELTESGRAFNHYATP